MQYMEDQVRRDGILCAYYRSTLNELGSVPYVCYRVCVMACRSNSIPEHVEQT